MHAEVNVVCIVSRYIDTHFKVDIFHWTHHYCTLECQDKDEYKIFMYPT